MSRKKIVRISGKKPPLEGYRSIWWSKRFWQYQGKEHYDNILSADANAHEYDGLT